MIMIMIIIIIIISTSNPKEEYNWVFRAAVLSKKKLIRSFSCRKLQPCHGERWNPCWDGSVGWDNCSDWGLRLIRIPKPLNPV